MLFKMELTSPAVPCALTVVGELTTAAAKRMAKARPRGTNFFIRTPSKLGLLPGDSKNPGNYKD
jgi:hypothetical protein